MGLLLQSYYINKLTDFNQIKDVYLQYQIAITVT